MADIITDVDVLHRRSDDVDVSEAGNIVSELKDSIPATALGLAAPQINIHKRVFIANLSMGSYAFVNPELTWKSSNKLPSIEACLSIPGVSRCVERHSQVEIAADSIIVLKGENFPDGTRLTHNDAFIVQHENDHLDGVLITDLDQVQTSEQKVAVRKRKRKQRILASRQAKELKKISVPVKPQKISAKKQVKLKKEIKRWERADRRREKIRVEIAERSKAEHKQLFDEIDAQQA